VKDVVTVTKQISAKHLPDGKRQAQANGAHRINHEFYS
jgi:hypothetical protein